MGIEEISFWLESAVVKMHHHSLYTGIGGGGGGSRPERLDNKDKLNFMFELSITARQALGCILRKIQTS
jgi:hypothetical protein